ncbi:MAG TPA: class I SAM-dependent methyltransferase [Kofleriaceae bacterium]|nr:class I SAM-dependent methyltransferase [Kofleriaceae bacterium]
MTALALDPDKLNEFLGRFVADLGAVMHAPLVILGDRLGLYAALAEGPASARELAARTKTDARYVTEWLAANAASGYVTYAGDGRYTLTPEQAATLADRNSPANVVGGLMIALSVARDLDHVEEIFRSGKGMAWGDHHDCLFEGTMRFFRAGYARELVSSWLPALDGVVAKLDRGARVADVGCGHGASTLLMAQAFPRSKFVGYDNHAGSIEAARKAAAAAGLSDRVTFEIASAKDYPGAGFDLVACFDCLHDMGDPVGASRHVRDSLAADGTWLLVEPFANDRLEDNLNPIGRIFYSASTAICTPASKSQEVGLALGAQAGERRLREVVLSGGFTRFRRATATPFNLILEARP